MLPACDRGRARNTLRDGSINIKTPLRYGQLLRFAVASALWRLAACRDVALMKHQGISPQPPQAATAIGERLTPSSFEGRFVIRVVAAASVIAPLN